MKSPQPLMGLHEVAVEAGVTPQAVRNWLTRKADFPRPAVQLACGPVWSSVVIKTWLEKRQKQQPRQARHG